jgi:hypothetical protein
MTVSKDERRSRKKENPNSREANSRQARQFFAIAAS